MARTYTTPVRSAQAEASRRAILDAALRLFARDGYAATTLKGIADEAGVAVETLYKHFQSKLGLMQRLLAREITGEDSPAERVDGLTAAQLREHTAIPDPDDRLRSLCSLASDVYERAAVIQAIFVEAAGSNPELRAQWRDNRARRVDDVRALLVDLADDGVLALPLERAVDIVWTLAGPEVYTMLTQERGWHSDQYEQWLFQILRSQLLGVSPTHGAMPRPG
jgi:AcrR family transcriptional regulator